MKEVPVRRSSRWRGETVRGFPGVAPRHYTTCIFRRFRPSIPKQSDQAPERADAGVLLGLEVVGLRRLRCRDATARPGDSGRQQASWQCTSATRYAPSGSSGGRLQRLGRLEWWTRTSVPRPSMSAHRAPYVNSASDSAVVVLSVGCGPDPSEGFRCRRPHRPSALAWARAFLRRMDSPFSLIS